MSAVERTLIAKFHYTDTDPNGPARTQRSFAAKKTPCPCPCPCLCRARVRVRAVEFSYKTASRIVNPALQCMHRETLVGVVDDGADEGGGAALHGGVHERPEAVAVGVAGTQAAPLGDQATRDRRLVAETRVVQRRPNVTVHRVRLHRHTNASRG